MWVVIENQSDCINLNRAEWLTRMGLVDRAIHCIFRNNDIHRRVDIFLYYISSFVINMLYTYLVFDLIVTYTRVVRVCSIFDRKRWKCGYVFMIGKY